MDQAANRSTEGEQPAESGVRSLSPMGSLLGEDGSPPRCKRFGDMDVSVHWWATDAKPGDTCLCGQTTRRA